MLQRITRYVGPVIGWAITRAWFMCVIVASVVAALCGVAVVAFIILECWALLTGQG